MIANLTAPAWYGQATDWLLRHGWPALLTASLIMIGVTVYLIATKQAALLAGWLIYLYMP